MSSFDPWIAAALSMSATIALVGPLVLATVLWRALKARWLAWLIGAGTFVVFQGVLRLPWQIALGLALKEKVAADPVVAWTWLAVSALSAGLFEETGRYVAYRFFWKDRTAVGGVMLGAGHGGIESIVLVGLNLAVSAVLYVLLSRGMTLGLPEAQLVLVKGQFAKLTPALALAGGAERLSSMAVHCGLSLLVLQTFTRGSKRWLWAAVAFHGLSNLVGVGVAKAVGVGPGEAVIGLFALAALAWTVGWVRAERRSLADGRLA
ncbi:MAG: hypothetical protein AMXMBFR34_33290 [Myxococcaceae bacterium]